MDGWVSRATRLARYGSVMLVYLSLSPPLVRSRRRAAPRAWLWSGLGFGFGFGFGFGSGLRVGLGSARAHLVRVRVRVGVRVGVGVGVGVRVRVRVRVRVKVRVRVRSSSPCVRRARPTPPGWGDNQVTAAGQCGEIIRQSDSGRGGCHRALRGMVCQPHEAGVITR